MYVLCLKIYNSNGMSWEIVFCFSLFTRDIYVLFLMMNYFVVFGHLFFD